MYMKLVQIPVRYLYCVTLAFLMLLAFAWWYFVYHPSLLAYDRTQLAIGQLFAQKQLLKKSEREVAQLAKVIADLQNNMHVSDKQTNAHSKNALAMIADIAASSGLTMNLCRLCAQPDAQSGSHEVATECRGSLEQIITFFEQLKKCKQYVECSKCDITRMDNQNFSVHAMLQVT